ncbi:MAG TPA: endonuclease/exonuclease/phosphatase family protein [Kofleriaceae bacterium]|nr:endonuclease/exonuclease/phosphatase family protein [Kofleriaceae bacterium]
MIPENLPDSLPTGDPSVKLVTANTALSLTIKYAEQREPLIVDALNTLNADVVCVQEVWNHLTGVVGLAAMLEGSWPYIFYSNINTTPWGNGLMILSKHPLYRGRHLRFAMNDSSGVIDRIIIGADVVTSDSHFHFLCTHLEPSDVPIRNAEIAEIRSWAEAEGYLAGKTFLLGDFNTGPATGPAGCSPTCKPADVTGYDLLRQDWTDPNEGWDQCTYCRDIATPMQLLGVDPDDPDKRIDHCFYRGIGTSTLQAKAVVLDQSITVTHPQDGEVVTNYSDHLAVSCTFGP